MVSDRVFSYVVYVLVEVDFTSDGDTKVYNVVKLVFCVFIDL